jgi:TonB family protein
MIAEPFWLLAEIAIKSFVVLAAAFTLAAALRRRSPAERHLLWVVVVTSLLALPAFVSSLPALWIPLSADSAQISERGSLPGLFTGDFSRRQVAEPVANDLRTAAGRPTMPQPLLAAGVATIFMHFSTWGYLAVTAWLLFKLVCRFRRVSRRVHAYEPLADARLLRLVENIRRERGIRRTIHTRMTEEHQTPWVWGIARPVLVLPRDALRWDAEMQANAVMHELSHVSRFDLLTAMIAHTCCALYWFQPLAWCAARRMAQEAECACDDRVLLRGAQRVQYAQQLVDLAQTIHDETTTRFAVSMAAGTGISQRVLRIVDLAARRDNVSKVKIVAVFAAALILIGSLSALRSQELDAPSGEIITDEAALQRIATAGPRNNAELEALVAAFLESGKVREAVDATASYIEDRAGNRTSCAYCIDLLKTDGLITRQELQSVLLPAFDEVERRAYDAQSGELFLRLAELSIESHNRTAVARGSRYLLEAFRIGGVTDAAKRLRVEYLLEMQRYADARSLAQELQNDPGSTWYQSPAAASWIAYIDTELKRADLLFSKLLVADKETRVADEDYLPLVKAIPVYPEPALGSKTEGYAVVQFTVTATGRTADIAVVESTDRIFDQASIDAAEQFIYMPQLVNGIPTATTGVRNKITYAMDD